MTSKELVNILRGKVIKFIKDNVIVITNEEIVDSFHLNHEYFIDKKIQITGCIFKENFLISNCSFSDYVIIEACSFEKGIRLNGGRFEKDLNLKWISVKNGFQLNSGTFKKINLSILEADSVLISGGEFDLLDFGRRGLGKNQVQNFSISNDNGIIGNIKVIDVSIKKNSN